jgi:protein-L-isoaspartate O-methyltransferase
MNDVLGPTRLAALRTGMAGRVAAAAGLGERWQRAFAAVPREAFIPRQSWRDQNGTGVPVDRASDPDTWAALLYDEYRSIVTQLDDGAESGAGRYSSSSSMPIVMARMLAELAANPRRTVLEVGTGTGYNAALLAEYFGAQNVTTIEVDQHVAERAEKALVQAGYPITVLNGDGVDGLNADVFDALLCTCAIAHLPGGWLQAVPDGTIIAPFYPGWYQCAALVLHTRDGRAVGRFKANFSFMQARAHRWEGPRPRTTEARERETTLAPWAVSSQNEPAAFACSLLLPGVDYTIDARDGAKQLTAWDNAADQSWAAVEWERVGTGWNVCESGPRALWAEIEVAHATWAGLGEPSPDRYTVHVEDGRGRITLHGRPVTSLPIT